MRKTALWLGRDLMAGPYVCLCCSEEQYADACNYLKVPYTARGNWVSSTHADATTHFFESEEKFAAVVCLRPSEKISPIQTAALLVHEAVHIWQHHCERIGELSPSSEFEAYSVQALAQSLMYGYVDLVVVRGARGK